MFSTTIEEVFQQVDQATLILQNPTYFDSFDVNQELYTSTKEEAQILLRARNEEIIELQSRVDSANIKANELTEEYNTIVESSRLYKDEASEQEQLYRQELEMQQQLQAEIDELEKELAELTKTQEKDTDPSTNQLRIALYRGLGLEAHLDNNEVDKMILTSRDLDMRTVSLKNTTPYTTANYIWDFIN